MSASREPKMERKVISNTVFVSGRAFIFKAEPGKSPCQKAYRPMAFSLASGLGNRNKRPWPEIAPRPMLIAATMNRFSIVPTNRQRAKPPAIPRIKNKSRLVQKCKPSPVDMYSSVWVEKNRQPSHMLLFLSS